MPRNIDQHITPMTGQNCHSKALILASASPRRRQLLAEAGYRFEVIVPSAHAEQDTIPHLPVEYRALHLAWMKAADVAQRVQDGLIVACDTLVECDGQVVGKPRDRQHAEEILRLLLGKEHRVVSGLCFWQRPENVVEQAVDITRLVMDKLSDAQIAEYLDSGQWQGKAGAFGYQDRLGWVHIVEGSETNVVGLPMELLQRMLVRYGIKPE